jgi:hypothetical protein
LNITETIAREWLERIAHTYPPDAARLIGHEQDAFRNPIGKTFREAAAILVAELLNGMNASRILAALESIIRIRAVQNFTPGRALAFILELKEVVKGKTTDLPIEVLCARIDHMVLVAFDLYMKCREQTYEVRVNEAKRQVSALERAIAAHR